MKTLDQLYEKLEDLTRCILIEPDERFLKEYLIGWWEVYYEIKELEKTIICCYN